MLAEVFFYGIIIYLIYKIVFDFIVPVSTAGKQIKQQFQNMHQQAENVQQQNQQQNNTQQKSKNVVGDYIDFEEVKK